MNNKGIIKINIPAFDLSKYKNKHIEFVQYVAFIYLKTKECNKRNNCLSHMYVYLKGVTSKHFSPLFLKKILRPFNELVKDDEEEVLVKIYVYHVNKYVKYVWSLVKHIFDPITVKKFVLMTN